MHRRVLVGSQHGMLYMVNYSTRQLEGVFRLHEQAINCVKANEAFCATGSDDSFVRVWPLDFSDLYLEAKHEAPISSIDFSLDGIKLLCGSSNGCMVILDTVE